jgi:competence protein ComEA
MNAVLERHRGLLTVMLLNLTALGGVVWTLRDPRAGAVRVVPPPTVTPAPTATAVRLHVYVSGAVATPDVVVLGAAARAGEAIAAAGGFAPDADRAAVNLAAPLADGQQLHVPAEGEAPGPPPGLSAPPAGGSGAGPAASAAADAPIDVNRAAAAELEALPGVGPALAARIVAHRTANGPFRAPADLLAVSGIGQKTLERFADRIVVR